MNGFRARANDRVAEPVEDDEWWPTLSKKSKKKDKKLKKAPSEGSQPSRHVKAAASKCPCLLPHNKQNIPQAASPNLPQIHTKPPSIPSPAPNMAASTTNVINRLRAFSRGEIDIPDLEMFQIIDAEILKAKQPFTTTHKVMFTNTFGAHKAIALVLSQLSPDCKKITFIMKGGVARHDHWRAEQLSGAGLLDFFDYTTGDELNPESLLWEIDLHTNDEGQQAVKDMSCVVFVPEDEEGRSLADFYVTFFQDRLDHGSKHPVTGERILKIPQLGQLGRGYIQHTIKEDDCEEALTYALGHLIDTVRTGTSMENDGDINMAEMIGGLGLYVLSKTNDVDKAWGDLDWLINTINGPHDIRQRRGPTGVQFFPT
ncbi:hypothetical protein CGMCC3_g14990 [Colletotrichum fructicola]|nr:uncharacterized protein CGMCC3_g14990 [Colletotrichum fructicola]KAE9568974.1 hypothetical protein CGMCC3_g14990 [Colletotrichum fructicola]